MRDGRGKRRSDSLVREREKERTGGEEAEGDDAAGAAADAARRH
jgi:hypothetical protein